MTFATCLNCIDGRVQMPVINWITKSYDIKYVDMITEPGMDGLLAQKDFNIKYITKKVEKSIEVHDTKNIFIVGHHDCAGNPVDDLNHKNNIHSAVNRVIKIFNHLNVLGLWLCEDFEVEKIIEVKNDNSH